MITFNSVDLKQVIRTLAGPQPECVFKSSRFSRARSCELKDVTAAGAGLHLHSGNLFFETDRRTIWSPTSRRPQYQQLVVRTFYLVIPTK